METLKALTESREFIIPEHQRGFSWLPSNFDDIVNDLTLAELLQKNHYVGPLVIDPTGEPQRRTSSRPYENLGQYSLQDGQQRMTTLMLACFHLHQRFINSGNQDERDLARDCKRCYQFEYNNVVELRIKNMQTSFNAKLEEIFLGNPPPADQTEPIRRLQTMSDCIRQHVTNLTAADAFKLGEQIISNLLFVEVDLGRAGVDKNLTFDAINTRGRPLSQFDKIKNFCVLLSSLRPPLHHLQPETKWFDSLKLLDTFEVSHKEDQFINDLFSVFHGVKCKATETHDKMVELYQSLMNGPNHILERELTEFVEAWDEYAKSFGFITTSNRAPHTARGGAHTPLCDPTADNIMTKIEQMDLKEIMRRVHTCAHLRYFHQPEFTSAVQHSEKYLFRMYAVAGHRTNSQERNLNDIARQIYHNGPASRGVNWYLGVLCWLLNKTGDKGCSLQKMAHTLGNGESKYKSAGGWKRGYYFLYEYERSFGASTHPWTYETREQTSQQEHIMPQTLTADWRVAWPDAYRHEKWVHRLGNLVLTESRSSNSTLGQKEIALKINDGGARYDFSRGLLGEREIHNYASDGAGGFTWVEKNILDREFDLIKFALDRWKLPCCDDSGEIILPESFNIEQEHRTISIPVAGDCAHSIPIEDEHDAYQEEE